MAWKFVMGALTGKLFGLGDCDEGLGAWTYTIQPGETMTSIASKLGKTVQVLLAANPSIEDPDMIFAGATLSIPGAPFRTVPHPNAGMGSDCCSEEDLPPNVKQAVEAAGGLGALQEQVDTVLTLHTTAAGDTLVSIAAALGVDPQLVIGMNQQVQDPAAPLPEGTQVLVPSAKPQETRINNHIPFFCDLKLGPPEDGMGGVLDDVVNVLKQAAGAFLQQQQPADGTCGQ